LHVAQDFRYPGGVNDQATGLRERKKQATREALARAGLELFVERGYDETTLDEIADAAGVSTRTIFAYFPCKEDILFSMLERMRDALAHALQERPPGIDALTALREFILATAPEKSELDCRLAHAITDDPTLASHRRARMGQLQEVLAGAIAEDLGADAADRRPQIAAASLAAAFELLELDVEPGEWKPPTREEIAAAIDPVLAFVRAGLEAATAAG
jgi:AcrR family transcriptional regulator